LSAVSPRPESEKWHALEMGLTGGIEFDWHEANIEHLAVHAVTPADFEEMLNNDPLDLDYDVIDGEDRYRSIGLTNGGRFLTAVWTVRNGKIRPITSHEEESEARRSRIRQ
jgi:uncharacterized DUF497 family protein